MTSRPVWSVALYDWNYDDNFCCELLSSPILDTWLPELVQSVHRKTSSTRGASVLTPDRGWLRNGTLTSRSSRARTSRQSSWRPSHAYVYCCPSDAARNLNGCRPSTSSSPGSLCGGSDRCGGASRRFFTTAASRLTFSSTSFSCRGKICSMLDSFAIHYHCWADTLACLRKARSEGTP